MKHCIYENCEGNPKWALFGFPALWICQYLKAKPDDMGFIYVCDEHLNELKEVRLFAESQRLLMVKRMMNK